MGSEVLRNTAAALRVPRSCLALRSIIEGSVRRVDHKQLEVVGYPNKLLGRGSTDLTGIHLEGAPPDTPPPDTPLSCLLTQSNLDPQHRYTLKLVASGPLSSFQSKERSSTMLFWLLAWAWATTSSPPLF